jgi:hypothetical protein
MFTHAHSDSDCIANGHCYSNTVIYADSYSYDNTQRYANIYSYGATESHADGHSYGTTKSYTDRHSYGYIYDHAECYGNGHSYSYSEADAHCPAQRNTTIAPYSAASPNAVTGNIRTQRSEIRGQGSARVTRAGEACPERSRRGVAPKRTSRTLRHSLID